MRMFFPIVALVSLAGALFAQSPTPFATPDPEFVKQLAVMPVEDLISSLQQESKAGLGTDLMARCDPGDAKFQGGELSSKHQEVSPVMHELITRGIHALPALIDHITDARPTKATVHESLVDDEKLENGKYGKLADEKLEIWLASDYKARDPRPSKEREGISTDPYSVTTYKRVNQYTLKVGDFCFVAVGQIVNRDLHALRYLAPLQLAVNTPVEVPVLAEAVKLDWGKLTPEEHEKSLEDDALHFADMEALKRLALYYPKSFDSPAVKLLNRPMYSSSLAFDYCNKTLFPEKSAENRRRLLARFREKNGDICYLGVQKYLVGMSTWTVTMEANNPVKVAANQVLADSFPDVDPYNPPFVNAATYGEQMSLIENLPETHSKAVDDALAGLLQSLSNLPIQYPENYSDGQAGIALVCAERLSKQAAYLPLVREALGKLVAALQEKRKKDKYPNPDWGGLHHQETLQEFLTKLPAKPADASARPVKN